ncbi:ROK family protein [Amnibacterium sp.]|uniref:ROK family protein n=1 Tax=Amnibacterium sp. TaxID=1872496 RepID=UPI0026194E43|nr:ROK family protein [Amnibacterium sp.]MCU1474771.1 fructokinase [Amnibacterium sp.]
MIAGVETGGTKVVCAIARADAPGEPLEVRRFPTTGPDETIGRINAYLAEAAAVRPLDAIGIASFGPVNVEPDRDRYGWVTGTPKPGWADTDLLGRIPLAGRVPRIVLNDVGAAALGEHRHGAGRGARTTAYATFGTGVGVGLAVQGRLVHGNGFPELGHLLVRRHAGDAFAGICPFHGDCIEGLASGPAVQARWGADSSSLPEPVRAEAFGILGSYVAQLVGVVRMTVGADRMVIGGGVLKAPGLLDEVRRQVPLLDRGYTLGAADAAALAAFVVPPVLENAGLVGALAAAADLLG